jgi:hypothetical protein
MVLLLVAAAVYSLYTLIQSTAGRSSAVIAIMMSAVVAALTAVLLSVLAPALIIIN